MPEAAIGTTYSEKLEAAVRDYLREYDNPVPDYALRRQLRERMAKLVNK
jgi:hypothetical protein